MTLHGVRGALLGIAFGLAVVGVGACHQSAAPSAMGGGGATSETGGAFGGSAGAAGSGGGSAGEGATAGGTAGGGATAGGSAGQGTSAGGSAGEGTSAGGSAGGGATAGGSACEGASAGGGADGRATTGGAAGGGAIGGSGACGAAPAGSAGNGAVGGLGGAASAEFQRIVDGIVGTWVGTEDVRVPGGVTQKVAVTFAADGHYTGICEEATCCRWPVFYFGPDDATDRFYTFALEMDGEIDARITDPAMRGVNGVFQSFNLSCDGKRLTFQYLWGHIYPNGAINFTLERQ